MNIIHTTKLSTEQKQHIIQLISACKEAEPIFLSAPIEDGLDYFLLYEKEQLISMLFLFFPEETTCECCGFTLPSHRKQGSFSALLQDALAFLETLESKYNHDIDFCFLSDEHSDSGKKVLKHLGAEYWYSEYTMKRELSPSDHSYISLLSIQKAEDHIYTASLNNIIIGTCVTLPHEKNIYFYGFEIKEDLRKKGYGKDFLYGMLSLLSANYQTITLQVSSQNTPALSLYQKTGFHISETLSYYLY